MTGQAPKRRISPVAAAMASSVANQSSADDSLARILAEARDRIRGQMTPAQIEDPAEEDLRLAEGIIRPLVDSAFTQALQGGARMTMEPDAVVRQIMDEIFGFGPLAPYLSDPEIEEIILNGPGNVWIIHAARGKEQTSAQSPELAQRGMSKSELARRGGMAHGGIYDVCNEERPPTLKTLQAIARGLDVPMDVVFEQAGVLELNSTLPPTIRQLVYVAAPLPEGECQRLVAIARALQQHINTKER